MGASAQALATAAGETLAAAGETAVAAFDSVQERLSEALPQNVTLIWGGGASTNLNVPWKGIGVYAGGLLSGLFLAGALLTLPFADLGSAGLKKSLTLFENVLLDIDQVRTITRAGPTKISHEWLSSFPCLISGVGAEISTRDSQNQYALRWRNQPRKMKTDAASWSDLKFLNKKKRGENVVA